MQKDFKLDIPDFRECVDNGVLWTKDTISTMQINITRKCNLACKHCHVSCSPARKEDMTTETAEKCVDLFKKEKFKILDITGGAPEMSAQFKFMLDELSPYADKIIVRTNLTIHLLPEYEGYLDFMKDKKVELIASLPFYERDKTDRQRGLGVYDESIEILQKLCKMGYGVDPQYQLNLVFNPNGAILPGSQEELEEIYREKLKEYDITFNNLYTITNNPSGRFFDWLKRSGNLQRYMNKLISAFNPDTIEELMCRDMISINYDGRFFDCDFNLAINLGVIDEPKNVYEALKMGLQKRKIRLANHCYGCTAGAGSS